MLIPPASKHVLSQAMIVAKLSCVKSNNLRNIFFPAVQ